MLVACLLIGNAYGYSAESGSILSNEPEPAVVEEAPADTVPADTTTAETPAPAAETPEATQPAETSTDSSVSPGAPLRYVVKKGDTLWDIASHYLKEPWKWPELWYGNPNIKNPHLIYPGDVLYLTYVDGRPRLSREPPDSGASGVEKLSPRVREESLSEAIPTIPGDAIRAFLRGSRVVGATELDAAPYIVEFVGGNLIGGANMVAYAKGLGPDAITNHSIVRKGEVYRDPESNEILGYEASYTGSASLRTPGEPARVNLDTTVREVLVGDRLLPQDETDLLASAFYPHAPDAGLQGYIIAVTGGVSQISKYQIVTLNKGARDGAKVGQVFSIYQAGRQVRDPYGNANATVILPEEKAGLLMVFKTYERVSYALVMKSTRSIHLLDKFRTPENT
ncbi:MAG: LysM peptidoglycan-binding domain-containing protein [Nevskiales bacterium]